MSRKRTKITPMKLDPLIITTYRGAPNFEKAGTVTVDSTQRTLEFAQIDDSPTPNFRSLMKQGVVVMNPVSLLRITNAPCPINMTMGPYPSWYNGGREVYTGDIGKWLDSADKTGFTSRIPEGLDRMQAQALISAYAKVNAADVLSGEIMSDLGKTVSMLKSPFRSAISLVSSQQKKAKRLMRLNRSLSYTQAMAKAWLEYRYGWRPLILDTATLIKKADAGLSSSLKVRYVGRSGQRNEFNYSAPFSTTIYGDTSVAGTSALNVKCRVSAGVIYQVSNETESDGLARSLGTRVEDLPATAWEIIPFSFVVDWFVGVGDWIQAVTPKPGVTILGNWVTTILEYSLEYNGTITNTWSGITSKQTCPTNKRTAVSYERTVNNSLNITPVLKVGRPSTPTAISEVALLVDKFISTVRGR